ncbi:MAG: hypothetical protein LWX56_05300 [Ignavibacteria bacterium]|nr:hypothetical protein [Ignavibacteria bacterium]
MKTKISIIILALLFCGAAFGQSVSDLLSQSDVATLKEFNNQKALEKLTAADKASPNNWEVQWRISRAYANIANHMPSATDVQKQAQLAKYQEALDFANKTVKLAPDKSIGYLRRAVATGRIALFKGAFSVIGLVNDVRNDLEKSIKLNNAGNENLALAYYMLGRTHAKVCEKPKLVRLPLGLGWGNMETAFTMFQKAIELRPNFRMFHLDYAKALIEDDEYAKAKEQLAKIPSIPVAHEDDEAVLAESKTLYERIKNK